MLHTAVELYSGESHLHRDSETLVEGEEAAAGHNLAEAVDEAGELAGASLSQVSCQPGTGKVQRVHDQQRSGSGQTTCMQPMISTYSKGASTVSPTEQGIAGKTLHNDSMAQRQHLCTGQGFAQARDLPKPNTEVPASVLSTQVSCTYSGSQGGVMGCGQ